uniref:Secreted protein n=1 Tax=Steinernema glaseri TaxID=37863 RepID=A0A1I8AAC3_9BILA
MGRLHSSRKFRYYFAKTIVNYIGQMVAEWPTRGCVPVGGMRCAVQLGTIPHVLTGVALHNFTAPDNASSPSGQHSIDHL